MEQHFNLMYQADFYKVSHKEQYPSDVTNVSSTLVARGAKYNEEISKDRFYWFGVKLFIEKLHNFSDWFFGLDHYHMQLELGLYREFLEARLGGKQSIQHWANLWLVQKLHPRS